MIRIKRIFGALLLSLALAGVPVTFAGLVCGSMLVTGCNTSQQRIAYNAVNTSHITVEAAMSAWGDYVDEYHPPESEELLVKDAYQKYQQAAVLAIDAELVLENISSITNAPPGDVIDAETKKGQARQKAADALADLVALLRSFNVKI